MERLDQYVIFVRQSQVNSTVKSNSDESDLLPEFCHYKDEGCQLAPSCLECPFPECLTDKPWSHSKKARILRDREIVRLYVTQKISLSELMLRFNVSRRTVRRALAAGSVLHERF